MCCLLGGHYSLARRHPRRRCVAEGFALQKHADNISMILPPTPTCTRRPTGTTTPSPIASRSFPSRKTDPLSSLSRAVKVARWKSNQSVTRKDRPSFSPDRGDKQVRTRQSTLTRKTCNGREARRTETTPEEKILSETSLREEIKRRWSAIVQEVSRKVSKCSKCCNAGRSLHYHVTLDAKAIPAGCETRVPRPVWANPS